MLEYHELVDDHQHDHDNGAQDDADHVLTKMIIMTVGMTLRRMHKFIDQSHIFIIRIQNVEAWFFQENSRRPLRRPKRPSDGH